MSTAGAGATSSGAPVFEDPREQKQHQLSWAQYLHSFEAVLPLRARKGATHAPPDEQDLRVLLPSVHVKGAVHRACKSCGCSHTSGGPCPLSKDPHGNKHWLWEHWRKLSGAGKLRAPKAAFAARKL